MVSKYLFVLKNIRNFVPDLTTHNTSTNMKTIHFHLLGLCLLFVMAMPSMAQSARLDSLRRVEKDLELQDQQLRLKYDSVYRMLSQCKTDEERIRQMPALDKLEKESQQWGKKFEKVRKEITLEEARIEQLEREAMLAEKQAAVQARTPYALTGELNGHEWVDMGLPSGTRWATCNVGTTVIHGVGTRIAWGETASKKLYAPSTYKYNDSQIPNYAGNPTYDMATAKWGEGWCTPSKQQWDELIEHCDWDYVIINGVNGVLFTSSKTYNTIFMPATGYTDDESYKLKYTTYNLAYWASTASPIGYGAYSYIANYEHGYMTTTNRYVAHCVRAVCRPSGGAVSAGTSAPTSKQTADAVVDEGEVAVQDAASTSEQQSAEANKKAGKKSKKTTETVKEVAEAVQETADAVKKTANTIKSLQKIFR